jgi:transcriptional regulator with XRE-family HTH domain
MAAQQPTLNIDALYQSLDAQRVRWGWSWRAVAEATGCPPSLFTKLQKGGSPSADALVRLLAWLGLARDLGGLVTADGGIPAGRLMSDEQQDRHNEIHKYVNRIAHRTGPWTAEDAWWLNELLWDYRVAFGFRRSPLDAAPAGAGGTGQDGAQ